MLHWWDEAKPRAVKHPADIVAQGRASGQGGGVPSSARTRSGCRATLTSVARHPLSQGHVSKSRGVQQNSFYLFSCPCSSKLCFLGGHPVLRKRSRRARTL